AGVYARSHCVRAGALTAWESPALADWGRQRGGRVRSPKTEGRRTKEIRSPKFEKGIDSKSCWGGIQTFFGENVLCRISVLLRNSAFEIRTYSAAFGRFLYFSYSFVWRVSSEISFPASQRCFTLARMSRMSPSVLNRVASLPGSMEPKRSAAPEI